MGFVCTVAVMVVILAVAWIVSRWDARTAYRLLEHSGEMFFEPEKTSVDASTPSGISTANYKKRPYITPLIKKRIAAQQKWHCAVCKNLLDETLEIDHIRPLWKGGHGTDPKNLQALCKRCHAMKSAMEQSQSKYQ